MLADLIGASSTFEGQAVRLRVYGFTSEDNLTVYHHDDPIKRQPSVCLLNVSPYIVCL